MRTLHSAGFQEIELSDRPWSGEPPGEGAVRFTDRAQALAFLRRFIGDVEAMSVLRAIAARAAVSADQGLDDDAVVDQLASRLWMGTIVAAVTTRMRPVPYGGVEEAPEEKAPEKEEKADQDVEFEITDLFDDPFPGLEWILTYPDGKTTKSGKLGADGIVKESSVPPGNYQLTFKLVSSPRWATSPIVAGKEVKLEAQAAGFDPGTAGKFEIFCARATDQKPIGKASGKVSASRVLEGTWTPDEAAVKDLPGSSVVFRAKIGESYATSSPARVFVKHELELSDDQGPLADTPVIVRFSDGHEESAESKGGKLELLVPAGRKLVWVHLPEHPGCEVSVEPEGEDALSYVVAPDADGGGEGTDDGGGGDAAEDEGGEDEGDDAGEDEGDEDDEDAGEEDEGEDESSGEEAAA
ncbi:MAG: hypothetical protein U0359_39195 [Byssovorax sp.]